MLMVMIKLQASQWCDERAGHWDSAIAGSSALRAALSRNLRAEVAVLL